MLFPTISFAVFFAVVLPVSWLTIPHRTWWRLAMVAASWFFYGCAGWGFLPLLIGTGGNAGTVHQSTGAVHNSQRDRQGISVFCLRRDTPGVTLQSYDTIDGGRAAEVRFDNVALPADALIIVPVRSFGLFPGMVSPLSPRPRRS